jgi:hypothetical protein
LGEQQHQQDASGQQQPAGGEAPDLERIPVTKGERVAAVVGLAVLAVLALICVDLATGGKLSSRIGTVPAASTTDGEPCAEC